VSFVDRRYVFAPTPQASIRNVTTEIRVARAVPGYIEDVLPRPNPAGVARTRADRPRYVRSGCVPGRDGDGGALTVRVALISIPVAAPVAPACSVTPERDGENAENENDHGVRSAHQDAQTSEPIGRRAHRRAQRTAGGGARQSSSCRGCLGWLRRSGARGQLQGGAQVPDAGLRTTGTSARPRR
jgi:hypothetical protein